MSHRGFAPSPTSISIAEFIGHDEVEPGQVIGNTTLPTGAGLSLQPVDQVDDIEDAAARTVADQRPGDARWDLPVPVPPTRTTLR
jgi:hypothetical protein